MPGRGIGSFGQVCDYANEPAVIGGGVATTLRSRKLEPSCVYPHEKRFADLASKNPREWMASSAWAEKTIGPFLGRERAARALWDIYRNRPAPGLPPMTPEQRVEFDRIVAEKLKNRRQP